MSAVISSEALQVIFDTIAPDGAFSEDQRKVLAGLGGLRKAILLAFPPKAAGTFLRSAVVEAAYGQLVRVVHAQGGRDAQLYLPTFVAYYSGGITDYTLVAHVHLLALPANRHFLDVFGIRPIVMKRDIPDMLASYWDMLESDDNALKDGLNCHIPSNFREMSREAKGDFLIDVLGPWYVGFYAGWFSYAAQSPSVCMTDFSDLREKPVQVLQTILRHVGLKAPRAICEKAIATTWKEREHCRFNKGVEGRGAAYFSERQLARLGRMFDYYPELGPHRGELLRSAVEKSVQSVQRAG